MKAILVIMVTYDDYLGGNNKALYFTGEEDFESTPAVGHTIGIPSKPFEATVLHIHHKAQEGKVTNRALLPTLYCLGSRDYNINESELKDSVIPEMEMSGYREITNYTDRFQFPKITWKRTR